MSWLPERWMMGTIDDLVAEPRAITDGPFGSNLKTSHYTDEGPRVIRLENIGDCRFIDTPTHIAPDHFERLRKHEAIAGDIVIASLGQELPRACIVPATLGPAIVKADCIRVRVHRDIDARWVMYALSAPHNRAIAARDLHGVGRPRLGLKGLRMIPVPVPPREEQRRIVAAIDEQLSRLDAAEHGLRRATAAKELLPGRAIDAMTAGNWPVEPLSGHLREPLRNGHSSRRSDLGTGIRTLTLTAVTKRDFSNANTKLTEADPDRIADLWLEPGDLLVERSNTPELVGTAALYDGPLRYAIFPDLLIRVRPAASLLPAFLELVLRSTHVRRYFQREAQGIAGSMPKISQATIANLPVPVPPPGEQAAVVQRYLSLTDQLRFAVGGVANASGKAIALRRAVLDKAFRGRLVAQDPNDEPASVLLGRIAADRQR